MSKYYDLFSKHLSGVKQSGNEGNYVALCPFHNDRNPSFSFNENTGLWLCFACGEKGNAYQFAEKVGDKEWLERLTEEYEKKLLLESRKKPINNDKLPIAPPIIYKYFDRQGNLIYSKLRYEYEDGSKSFHILWNSEDKKLLLYDLLSLSNLNPLDISEVWFCEGEKCRDALLEATETRTDIIVLAYSQNPEKEIANSQIDEYLKGKKIVVFEDNDDIGRKKARSIIDYVKRYASEIKLISFPDKEKGYDIADFLSEDNSIDDALLLAKTIFKPQRLIITDLEQLKQEKDEPIQVIDDIYNIPKGVLGLVAGAGSTGKGFFLLWNILRWIEKYSVAYLSLEDPIRILKQRLNKLYNKRKIYIHKQTKQLMLDTFESLQNLTTESLIELIQTYIEFGYEIIIVDPISALLEDEKDNSEASKMMFELNKLCANYEVNIFLSHHIRKKQKGEVIKSKFDMLDLVRGASALHSNARYIWFLRRNANENDIIEAWNVKNSYLPNNRDYAISQLFSDEIYDSPKLCPIGLSDKGETIFGAWDFFYEYEGINNDIGF